MSIFDYGLPATLKPFAPSHSQADDKIQLGTPPVNSPGLAILSGFVRKHDFDKKKGRGTNGATLTFDQLPPCEGTIKFLIWTDAQYQAWLTFQKLFKYDPTKKSVTAVSIFHSSLAEINLSQVVCEHLGARVMEREPGYGLYSYTVKLCEWRPPPAKANTSTVATGLPNSNVFYGPPAQTPFQQQISAQMQANANDAALLAKGGP